MNKQRFPYGSIVLDAEGLSRAVLRDRKVWSWLSTAATNDIPVYASTVTLVETIHPKIRRSALRWTLSRIVLDEVTETVAHRAGELLASAGLHGHRYAIDAMVCATALSHEGPVAVLTSDPSDIATLTNDQLFAIKV